MSDAQDGHVPQASATSTEADHARLVTVVAAAAARGTDSLRLVWDDLLASYGAETASRAWQEALSSSGVGQT